MAISASSSSFDAQPVVELVQQRERVRARRRGDLQREHLTVARIQARRAGVNKRRQQVAGDVVDNRRTNRRQVLRQTRRGRRQRDGPGLVRAKRHQAGKRPASQPSTAPAGFAGVSGLPPVSRSSYTVCVTGAASGPRNVVLDTDGEAAGQRDEVAVRVGRNKDRRAG